MKYLIFNITVAATLVYLVAADDFGFTSSPENAVQTAQIEETSFPIIEERQDLTLDDVRPLVTEMIQTAQQSNEAPLSESDIKMIVAAAIEDAMTTQTSHVAAFVPQQEISQQPASLDVFDEEPLEEITVETPVTHAPPVETGGLTQPEATDLASNSTTQGAIQLADGESLMPPKTRQKELDKLVSSLELMFLDKTN